MITYEAVYSSSSSRPFLSKTIEGIYTKMSALGQEEEVSAIPTLVIESHLQNLGLYITELSSPLEVLSMFSGQESMTPFAEGDEIFWGLSESSFWWECLRLRMFEQESEPA